MSHRKFFLFIIVSVFICNASYCQKWDLRQDKDGIKIYTRDKKGSGIQEFRGETTVKSNLAGILALIDSVPEYPKWMYECTFAERNKRISWESGYIYSVIHSPWPLSNRDLCTYYKLSQDSTTKVVTISLKGVKDYLPVKPDLVRIPGLIGFWQLTPIAKGVTKIVYQMHCESGGSVPAAIVNAYITNTPYYNLLNLRNIVESPRYPKRETSHVKEF